MRRTVLFLLLIASTFALETPSLKFGILSVPTMVSPGGSFDIQVQLTNDGSGSAKTVLVYPEVKEPFSIKAGTDNQSTINELYIGKSATLDFSFIVSPTAKSDSYKVKIYAKYPAEIGTIETYANLSITVKGNPLIEILSVQTPEKIGAGESGGIEVNLKNIGTARAKQIRVLFNLTALTEYQIKPKGNPVFYIDELKVGEEKKAVLNFSVDGSAKGKIYLMPVVVAYQNEDSTEQTPVTRIASIGVRSDVQLNTFVGEKSLLVVGKEGKVTLTIANPGIDTAQFLMLKLKGDMEVNPNKVYISNLNSDDYDSVDLKVTPGKAGLNKIEVELTYRDPYNLEVTKKDSIEINVMSVEEAKKYETTFNWYSLAPFLVLIVLYLIYRKIRKK